MKYIVIAGSVYAGKIVYRSSYENCLRWINESNDSSDRLGICRLTLHITPG